jgi:hypothetical protein
MYWWQQWRDGNPPGEILGGFSFSRSRKAHRLMTPQTVLFVVVGTALDQFEQRKRVGDVFAHAHLSASHRKRYSGAQFQKGEPR